MQWCGEASADTQYQYPTISSRLFAGRASGFKCSLVRSHRAGKRGDKCLCRAMRVDEEPRPRWRGTVPQPKRVRAEAWVGSIEA
jgi:hypothetical protein